MQHSLLKYAALAGSLIFAGTTAQADNATIENALKSRPELSTFYSGLVSTGVIHELKEGQPYTVFAPTNDAFAKISQSQYPCFYTAECKAQVADILRKHIVPGEKHLTDMNDQGGIYSMFSIDNQHIVGGQPTKDKFTVDGQHVVSENQLLGGELYVIDGLMVTDNQLAEFVAPKVVVVHAAGTDLPPHVPEGKVVTVSTTDATKPIPY